MADFCNQFLKTIGAKFKKKILGKAPQKASQFACLYCHQDCKNAGGLSRHHVANTDHVTALGAILGQNGRRPKKIFNFLSKILTQ